MVVDDEAVDVVGHGTAVASIVHALAPDADIVSVRVLGPDNRGKGTAFAAGLEWAIDQGAGIINLSLSSRSDAMFGVFHDLADRAYFAGVLLVCAANNIAVASYPSLFAAVVSVAAHDVRDPGVWFYNPHPPVEFGAYGARRRRRLEGRRPDRRDGQQLRRAAHRGLRGADPGDPPGRQPVRGQDDPRGDGRRGHGVDDGPPGALTAPRPQGSETPRRLAGGASIWRRTRGVPRGCDPRRRSRR